MLSTWSFQGRLMVVTDSPLKRDSLIKTRDGEIFSYGWDGNKRFWQVLVPKTVEKGSERPVTRRKRG